MTHESTDPAGRMSLSEAMFAKLLVTSVWQNLFLIPSALDLVVANRGRDRNCVRGVVNSVGLEEKLLGLAVRLVELAAYEEVRRGVVRSFVQSCGREQSLEDLRRAARFGRGYGIR